MKTVTSIMTMNREKNLLPAGFTKRRLSNEFNRLLGRLNSSSRTVVKSALNEIRNLKNSLKRDLDRSYDIDHEIRTRREELACKYIRAGGRML
jgi:hypothetical protein